MDWTEIVQASEREQRPTEQVFQEELQKATLVALSREGLFQKIVFQGGTALRLFYGNPRFSEDLDFVLKEDAPRVDLAEYSSQIQNFTRGTFTFLDQAVLKTQKDTRELQRLILKTTSDSLPRTVLLHIELAFVPSYLNNPRILDVQPFQPAVQVEDEKEILADKLTALLCRPYLKGRDIWDIYYLTKEKDTEISSDLIGKKIRDYRVEIKDLAGKQENIIQKIDEEGPETLEAELKRFLPKPHYDRYHDHFQNILSHVKDIVKSTNLPQSK